jgi:hypothetical protein
MHLPEELVMKFFEKYLLIATLSSCVLTGGTAFGAESKYYTRVFDASNEVTDAKGMCTLKANQHWATPLRSWTTQRKR